MGPVDGPEAVNQPTFNRGHIMKEHLKFAASVLAVIAITTLIQKQFQIPVVGKYLPGGTA